MSKRTESTNCRRCGKMTYNKVSICAECQDVLVNLKKDLQLLEELQNENFLQFFITKHV